MSDIYLSPAFTERSQEELQILRKFDDKTPCSLFWLDIVQPLFISLQAKNILEVGPDKGDHTRLILTYCVQFDARIIVVEPYVKPELEEVVRNSDRITLYAENSHDALPKIDAPVDVVFLSGDINYYTAFGDLTRIKDLALRQNRPFPVVLVRATSWPYARRDMYYDPQSIPVEHRHDYEVKGMTPWSSELEDMKFNWPYANAKKEGGSANGILTAIE
ncbi:MAG: hypothetical protein MUO27_11420, partial [Sedimentisphaerales bacterium]|nr:hypothetical protein [Sedimentisphaerales bacterium]